MQLSWKAIFLLKHLSETFQNATIIARKLELQYLWIDSLFIIQDNTEDWVVESAQMESVYGNSYLVIATTASPGGSHSSLFDRPDSKELILSHRSEKRQTLFAKEMPSAAHDVMRRIRIVRSDFPLIYCGWASKNDLWLRRIFAIAIQKLFGNADQEVHGNVLLRGVSLSSTSST
jgi:hypothetical protein